MRRPTASTSASRCRRSRTRTSCRCRTSERWSSCGTRTARCSRELDKRALREGRRGANDYDGARGRSVAAAAQSDTGKRNISVESGRTGSRVPAGEAAPAGAAVARRRAWRTRCRRARPAARPPAPRKDRCHHGRPPFGAGDAKVLYEANSRITSAEFSPDGKTMFVNEGNDLYAVRLADPIEAYEIAKGATIAAAGRGGRGGAAAVAAAAAARSAIQRSSTTPARCRRRAAPNGQPVVLVGSTTRRCSSRARVLRATGRSTAPHNFVDKVDFETGQKTRVFEGNGDVTEDGRRAARRRLLEGRSSRASRRRWCRTRICAT